MKTNHNRNFVAYNNHRNAWGWGTSTERQIFLRRYWKKFRRLAKTAIKNKELYNLPLYKGDEGWSLV